MGVGEAQTQDFAAADVINPLFEIDELWRHVDGLMMTPDEAAVAVEVVAMPEEAGTVTVAQNGETDPTHCWLERRLTLGAGRLWVSKEARQRARAQRAAEEAEEAARVRAELGIRDPKPAVIPAKEMQPRTIPKWKSSFGRVALTEPSDIHVFSFS